jgi:hypothetical protein
MKEDDILFAITQGGTAITRAGPPGHFIIEATVTAAALPYIRHGLEQGMAEPGENEPIENWFLYHEKSRDVGYPITLESLTIRVNKKSKHYQIKPLKYDYCRRLYARWRNTGKIRK